MVTAIITLFSKALIHLYFEQLDGDGGSRTRVPYSLLPRYNIRIVVSLTVPPFETVI